MEVLRLQLISLDYTKSLGNIVMIKVENFNAFVNLLCQFAFSKMSWNNEQFLFFRCETMGTHSLCHLMRKL